MDEITAYLAELTSGDDEQAEAAVKCLAGIGEAALPALAGLFASPEEDVRWWAGRAVAEIRSPQAAGLLLALLQDGQASVRQCAALGLRLHPAECAVGPLAALLSDPDVLCASLAADALADIGPAAVPALLEVLAAGSQPARREAVRALALIADPRAIPALLAAQDDDSALVSYWSHQGLERMGVGMAFFYPT